MADEKEQQNQQGGEGGNGQTAEIHGTVQIKQADDKGGDKQQGKDAQQNKDSGPGAKDDEPQRKKRRVPPFVIIGAVALLVIVAALFYWHSTYYEDTDDAQIAGHIDQISPRVSGHIISVGVQEEQLVQKGQLMMEIDPHDYQAALDQAKANVAAAEAAWRAAEVNVPVESVTTSSQISSQQAGVRSSASQIDQAEKQLEAAQAQVDSAKANANKTRLDLERYTPLVQKDVISKQQYDQAVAAAQANDAAVNQAQANVLAQQQAVRVARDKLLQSEADLRNAQTGPRQVEIQKSRAAQAEAQYLQAKAQQEQAELNLSYTKIYAPYSGIISKKSVELGQNLSVGQSVFTLVSLDDLWVIANFKETQLRSMQNCQPVSIKVDTTDKTYSAKVTQIGGATGSDLSLFPAENATGNYVKVVQRIPVRLDFTNLAKEDPNHELRPGMSVEPKVRIKDWGNCQNPHM